jgi:hypothetical protein
MTILKDSWDDAHSIAHKGGNGGREGGREGGRRRGGEGKRGQKIKNYSLSNAGCARSRDSGRHKHTHTCSRHTHIPTHNCVGTHARRAHACTYPPTHPPPLTLSPSHLRPPPTLPPTCPTNARVHPPVCNIYIYIYIYILYRCIIWRWCCMI